MITREEFRAALGKAIREAGSQTALAEKAEMTQSQISDYLRGRFQFENITVGNLYRLFPGMTVDFFGRTPPGTAGAGALQEQLLEIFRSLEDRSKVRLVAMAAANFGDDLKKKTKQG